MKRSWQRKQTIWDQLQGQLSESKWGGGVGTKNRLKGPKYGPDTYINQ